PRARAARRRGTTDRPSNGGLDGVNIDVSSICFIDGAKGELIYRGYDIRELANKASYEEVVHLLWEGELPTRSQLEAFRAELRRAFEVPAAVTDLLRTLPRDVSPMHALRSAVSLLGALDETADGVDLDNVKRIGQIGKHT